MSPLIWFGGIGFIIFFAFIAAMWAKFYRKVEQGKALIVNKMRAEPDVTFTGSVVYPIFHKAEIMDISVKTIEIDRRGKEGLICKDNIRADIKVTFFVRVNKTKEDVIKVAQSIGCERASDSQTLDELFSAKFSEALKTVGKQLDFVDLYTRRDDFRDQIIQVIGTDLNGYSLEDAAIDYLEQTPIEALDPQNILDAQGIRKITELTATEHVRTNEFENDEKKSIRKQDVEAAEAILALDRQKADAEAKQQREIDTVRAREAAETEKVRKEEWQKAENARIKAEEEVQINEENKNRQVEVAVKNRERVVAVESERVEKDRQLEAISREREVELQRIDKEKALEKEKKEIQDVIRERIAVEKTVAEEEERIKELRVVEESRRTKQATVIAAEAEAEEALVKDVKAAEAAEAASKHRAKERLTLAEAALEASEREAKAKMRLAEAVQAEQAAPGLASARVKEADAIATEKHGLAEVRVREADAVAVEKLGTAEATVLKERAGAEALGIREKLTAEATGTREKLTAEATGVREKLTAEAAGITEKAEAMKLLDEASREHEEFRLRIENQRLLGIEGIQARKDVAEAKARILGEAFKTAKIDIVGGDGAFLDRMVNSISMGKSVDAMIGRSDTAGALLGDYTNGDRSLLDDLKGVLSDSSTGAMQNLTLSALLMKLMASSDGQGRDKLQKLLEEAKSLGVSEARL